MKKYKNLDGNSGIAAYETGSEFIRIKFVGSDETYTYSYKSAGKKAIEIMKSLSEKGIGLSTYISQNVHDKFEKT